MTQLEIVKRQLRTKGFITRNWCLNRFISRLGARICELRNEGWDIKGERVYLSDEKYDYIYTLNSFPE